MKITRSLVHRGLLLSAALSVWSAFVAADPIGETIRPYVAADPSAPELTPADIASRDRFWPFRVMLREPWTPSGRDRPIHPRPAVLVRVNPDGTARLDFAGEGRHEVPIGLTDLLVAAERVRRGEETKMAPNLVLTIGNKLLDPRAEKVRVLHIRPDTDLDAILCVFADPATDEFVALARSLEAFRGREDLQIVLFPQTDGLHDSGVGRRLRQLAFPVPYVRARYKKPFTRSLLSDEPVSGPHLQLATLDGRLLLDRPGDPRASVAQIEAALTARATEDRDSRAGSADGAGRTGRRPDRRTARTGRTDGRTGEQTGGRSGGSRSDPRREAVERTLIQESPPSRSSSDSTIRDSSSASRAPLSGMPFTKKAGVPVTPAASPARMSCSTKSA